MALINCHECSKEISGKAPACPHCGAPNIYVVESPEGPSSNSMKMFKNKKGSIALWVLSVFLLIVSTKLDGLGLDNDAGLWLGLACFALSPFAFLFGSVGTFRAIRYEKWVEYRDSEVKNAVVKSNFAATNRMFIGAALLGELAFFLERILPSNSEALISLGVIVWVILLPLGIAGYFLTWVRGFAYDMRSGKERRSLKNYAVAMAPPVGVIILLAFRFGFIGGVPDEVYETYYDENGQLIHEWYYENGQLMLKGSYETGDRHGPWEAYHENGQLSWKGNYNVYERVNSESAKCGEWFEEGETVTYNPCPPDLEGEEGN